MDDGWRNDGQIRSLGWATATQQTASVFSRPPLPMEPLELVFLVLGLHTMLFTHIALADQGVPLCALIPLQRRASGLRLLYPKHLCLVSLTLKPSHQKIFHVSTLPSRVTSRPGDFMVPHSSIPLLLGCRAHLPYRFLPCCPCLRESGLGTSGTTGGRTIVPI